MPDDIRRLIFAALDGTIQSDEFERLQSALESDATVREEYLAAAGIVQYLSERASSVGSTPALPDMSPNHQTETRRGRRPWPRAFSRLAVLTLSLLMACVAFWFGQQNASKSGAPVAGNQSADAESIIAGHATLRRSVDVRWSPDGLPFREGDVLPNGPFLIDAGVAEIDFFCGATLMVEGPAALDIQSDWAVLVHLGRLRANVPPAARGFIVRAADSEIIDLGTEFALEVTAENARVQVLDGEVELRGGRFQGERLTTGQTEQLKGTNALPSALSQLSTHADLQKRKDNILSASFEAWRKQSIRLRSDNRLIAYFAIADDQQQRMVRNVAESDNDRDGLIVGPVERKAGRFGIASAGLDFGRPGARVRTRIDGNFAAFTFFCWVRIDGLDHRYNALFMSDGYENGEPHWQIRDDGRLMFSVMVDDTKPTRRFDRTEQKFVTTAGLHHVYLTEPVWDISQSGQWFHIAAVYDPAARRVTQFVNGSLVASEEIADSYVKNTLKIGPAELGNWGQPFRDTPWFAVRNLNGTLDELAVFNAALSPEEISSLYESGKPPGH